MKYGQAISSAFSTLKSGALWGFAATTYGAIAMLYAVLLGGAAAIAGPSGMAEALRDPASLGSQLVAPLLLLAGALTLAVLITIPLSLIMHGGFVHLADEILAGRPASMGQGWSFGARRMGRTFGIDFLVGLLTFLGSLVAMIPFGVAVFGLAASSGGDTPGAGAFVGICCGYLVLLVFIVALSLVAAAYESLAIRYGLVGGRTVGDALGSAWTALKARWKNVLVFSLIAMGLGYAYNMVASMVTVPLQFLLMPGQFFSTVTPSAEQLPRLFGAYAILMVVSVFIAVPWMVFRYSLWGAFFRQLTGLDAIAATPAPAAPVAPVAPELPAPTTPPAPEPPATDA